MKRVGNWLLSRPTFVRSLMLVALVIALVVPSQVEAQGCVAVTYGCPVSGPEMEPLTQTEEVALGVLIWWNFVIFVFILGL